MSEHHGALTIKEWIEDLVSIARSGREFKTSAGAEPGRTYAYLEYHSSEEEHSILLFRVEADGGKPEGSRRCEPTGSKEPLRRSARRWTPSRTTSEAAASRARLSGWRVVHAEVVEIGDVERLGEEVAPTTAIVSRIAPIAIEVGAFAACAESGSAA